MSIIISNIRIGIDASEQDAFEFAKNKLQINDSQIKKIYVSKKSLDARHRENVSFVVSVAVDLNSNESETANAVSDPFVKYSEKRAISFEKGKEKHKLPCVIAGFGPAGIFAAYVLAQNGYRPVVYERGGDMESRVAAVDAFWKLGILNEKTNVQFGEGGAGTFSDGKLTTRITDSHCDYILETLVKNGAPSEILQNAKPHIGTDKLRAVIMNMRHEIIAMGGEVHFNSKITDIIIKNNRVAGIAVNFEKIDTDTLVLAIGHSARDTFQMLYEKQTAIENKPFSVGVRIEQLQDDINIGLYGDLAGHKNLPIGEYQLSQRCKNRCVYTFCMCPGGVVVPSASENGGVVTNGMSEHARNGKNANSALVVSVDSSDFGNAPLDGMNFQRKLEEKAFILGGGGYKAPASTVKGFLSNNNNYFENFGAVIPSYSIGVEPAALNSVFSDEISKMLRLGLQSFGQKLKGFSSDGNILTGVETRTSSPLRILRNNETMQSINVEGLFPCGEGAGYAGGIVSAAVDGIAAAKKIMLMYAPA